MTLYIGENDDTPLTEASDELLLKEFKDSVYLFMKKADLYRNIFVAMINEFFKEVEKRLKKD